MFKNYAFWDVPGSPVVKTSSSARGVGSIPSRGANIPHDSQPKNQTIKQKRYRNKFNKDFKNGPHQKKIFLFLNTLCFLPCGSIM